MVISVRPDRAVLSGAGGNEALGSVSRHSNSLKNAKKHLLQVHYLNEGGNIWRMEAIRQPAQASGIVNSNLSR